MRNTLKMLLLLLAGCGAGHDRYEREHALGLLAIERSELARAEAHFRSALAREDQPAARLDLARVLLLRKDLEAAERQFRQFVARDDRPQAYLQVFTAYYLLRHPDPARRWLEQALARFPREARLHAALGELEASLHNHDAALLAYEKGLALAPRAVRDRFHVGIARSHLLRTMASLSAERDKLGPAPDWAALHRRMSQLEREGKLAIVPAVLSLKRALYINPDNLQAHLLLGSIYQQTGRLAEAQLELEQAVRIAPRLAPAHYLLGSLRERRGQSELAIASYREALALEPALQEVRGALAAVLLERGAGAEALQALFGGAVAPAAREVSALAQRLAGSARAIDALIHTLERDCPAPHRAFAVLLLRGLTGAALGDDAAGWRKWQRERSASKK